MNSQEKSNNQGAISALKGYRAQFLYSLFRILSFKDHEDEFHPEGKYEDLDIYNKSGEVIEIIQIKNLGSTLTLSEILTSKKENTFLKRAIKARQKNKNPKIKLVSFGPINEDIKNLTEAEYSNDFIKKIVKQGLNQKEIESIKGNFEYEIVRETELINKILSEIEKWGTLSNLKVTLDLLIYWVYFAAESQEPITKNSFKDQFSKILKFQSERISFNKTFNTNIITLDNNIESENTELLKTDFYKGISASYKHILANVDIKRDEKLELIKKKFCISNIIFIHGASGQGKSTLAYRYIKENCASDAVFELKYLFNNINPIFDVINSLDGISKGIRFPITIYMDIDPGANEWANILKELASKKNFNFILTIREEDWNSVEIDDKFSFSEIELLFEKEEAELIYNSLNNYNQDIKFIDFNDAWESFGGRGQINGVCIFNNSKRELVFKDKISNK